MTNPTGKGEPARDVDEIIVAALSEGMSYRVAGELAGCSAKTVQRRMADETFAGRVASARSVRVDQITGRLGALGDKALQAFDDALEPDMPPPIRMAAGRTVLRELHAYRAATEIEPRLQHLEAVIEQLVSLIEGEESQ